MLLLYGASQDQVEGFVHAIQEDRRKRWWEAYQDVSDSPYVTYEAMAASIKTYGGLAIPGLLQTKDYARAVLLAVRRDLTPEEAARGVEFRMLRQAILTGDDPPALSVVVDEAALRRRRFD
jgi:hypothetical protein